MEHQRLVVSYVRHGKDIFGDWLKELKDEVGRTAIIKRIDRMRGGNLGDHRPVGEGIFEIRIHLGPGYRVYYGEDGPRIVLLLCAGDKSTQSKDIRRAKELWADYRRPD